MTITAKNVYPYEKTSFNRHNLPLPICHSRGTHIVLKRAYGHCGSLTVAKEA